jgi:hypothetical protein
MDRRLPSRRTTSSRTATYHPPGFVLLADMKSIQWPWAIVLCKFSDRPSEPRPVDYYEDLFTRHGTGGLADYWKDVSLGNLDLTGSRVFGWLTMNHTTAEVPQLTFPGQRDVLVQWGRDAAAASGIDLTPFRQVLVVHNYGVDHGAAGNGVVIVHQDPALCEMGFISHEMGHGLGLPHSFSANPDFQYGDGWDVMSFATTTFQFPVAFRGSSGQATVGLNARNLDALGVLEPSRRWAAPAQDFSATVVLDPLNQPQIGNHGHLVAAVPRPDGSRWTLEFRSKHGWDQAIPQDAVLLHEVRTNSLSYLQPGMWQQFTAGQSGTIPNPDVSFRVTSIASAPATATVRLWDLPDGSLRREDSKPKVYLIENGTKRWVTSPAVLTWLGRTWADVKVVPDGALAGLPDGADVVLPPTLTVSIEPYPLTVNRQVTTTVSATDQGTGAPVAGRVIVNGSDVAATNTPFAHTFRTRRVGHPPDVEIVFPTVTVRAAGYPETDVDTGH